MLPVPSVLLLMPSGSLMPCCCLLPVSLPLALLLGLLSLHHNRGWGRMGGARIAGAGSDDKESACSIGDPGSITGLGRHPGRGHGNPVQYPGLENPTDRGAWWLQYMGSHRVRQDWVISDEHLHFLFLSRLLGFWVPLPQAGGPELCVLLQLEEWGGGSRGCVTSPAITDAWFLEIPEAAEAGKLESCALLSLLLLDSLGLQAQWELGGQNCRHHFGCSLSSASSWCSVHQLQIHKYAALPSILVWGIEKPLLRYVCFTMCRLRGRDKESTASPTAMMLTFLEPNVFWKGPGGKCLRCRAIFVETTTLCCCRTKTDINNAHMDWCGWILPTAAGFCLHAVVCQPLLYTMGISKFSSKGTSFQAYISFTILKWPNLGGKEHKIFGGNTSRPLKTILDNTSDPREIQEDKHNTKNRSILLLL